MFKTGLLIGPSTGDRFEISNAIEVLLPLEKLTELLAWMRGAERQAGSSDDTPAAAAHGDWHDRRTPTATSPPNEESS